MWEKLTHILQATVRLLPLALLALSFSACGPIEVGIERPVTPGTAVAHTAEPSPTFTATAALGQVGATATPAPPPDPTPMAADRVRIYVIALEDGGQMGREVGCGDSVVAVERQIEPTQEPLRAALEELLSLHERYYGESGLYNALHQSDLQVDSAVIEDGRAVVRLSGDFRMGGICDQPRAMAQLEETARQFAPQVVVYIN